MEINGDIDPVWTTPAQLPSLDSSQVHIWRANLDLPEKEIAQLASLLSPDEIDRANRFRFSEHKRRFIAARGILRQLLGSYLKISPSKIKFEYSDRGKPSLAQSNSDSWLQFNVSHSQEYALYGFTQHHLIGVDIEYLRDMNDAAKIAERFFSPSESQLIASLPKKQQLRVFFKLWTAKEAYLKAIGTGLANSLDSVEILLEPDAYPKLLTIKGDIQAAKNWSMSAYIPAPNYVATTAVNSQINQQQIYCWHWQPNKMQFS